MSAASMHQLIVEVLTHRDLSRAGDLFTIEDRNLEPDLDDLIATIQSIADESHFVQRSNDQAVVEICLTRITGKLTVVCVVHIC